MSKTWNPARCVLMFRPDARTAASTLQFSQGPHKAVLRYQLEAIKTQANFNTLGVYYSYNFNSGVERKTF